MEDSTSLPLRKSYGKVVKVILEIVIILFCFLLQYYFINTLRTLHMLHRFTYFISHDSLVLGVTSDVMNFKSLIICIYDQRLILKIRRASNIGLKMHLFEKRAPKISPLPFQSLF